MLSGRIENFKEYSQFDSLKSFNTTIEMFLADHKKDFTKGELVAFKRLVRYSAKYFGVANAKIGTLLKTINEKLNGFGISRSTFERMLRKAKDLGILSIENTSKPKGGKGHNVYIFNTIDVLKRRKLTYCEKDETSTDSKDEKANSEGESINLFKSNNIKRLKIRKDVALDSSFTASYVPKEFVQAVKPFYDHAAVIEDFWKSVFLDTKAISHIVEPDTITYTAINAFKQAIRGYKRGKIKTNLVRYFTGTFKKLMDQTYSELPFHVFSTSN
ncbi:hypothetical protein OKW24_005642 [Peribacillus simplex]|uniref:hypothetical protein n=1 Tax=Peribacillus simplex TaxID=1478 RepID=UPI0024E1AC5B|nr:hypothetical protein [Peribacillus simplex]MDF9763731.1 hypothetical protein [Peribacillus simplex]MDF9763746.1 hypothetical protein [Peribacillus simplex]